MSSAAEYQHLLSTLYQAFVEFPYSAFTIPRQLAPATVTMAATPAADPEPSRFAIGTALFDFLQDPESVSSRLAENPKLTPGEAWKELFGRHEPQKPAADQDPADLGKGSLTDEELMRARQCGRWGPTEPSDLFIRLYHDALCTLDEDLERGVVSPYLMGSHGVVPLTIISVIPDIVRHMANLIVRADKEVFLATNFWINSVASSYITRAIRELSRRAGERGTKVVVKILYDRGSPKQLFEPHYLVPEKEYTSKAVGLPAAHEIPNVDMQVMNYHNPVLGTFHSKFMVVDRRIGIVQSNNIQDNENVEMMVQVEGPIVDGLYDMALLSWHKGLEPPMPNRASPAAQAGINCFGPAHDRMFSPDGSLLGHSAIVQADKLQDRAGAYGPMADQAVIPGGAPSASQSPDRETDANGTQAPNGTTNDVHANGTNAVESPVNGLGSGTRHEGDANGVAHAAESPVNGLGNGVHNGGDTNGGTHATESPVNGLGNGSHHTGDGNSQSLATTGQHPTPDQLPEFNAEEEHYDDDLAGEVARVQASVAAKPGETQRQAVTRHLNHTSNKGFEGDAPECDAREEMTPYLPHAAHAPVPMALVNRAPYGRPNNKSLANPQNAAWLSALRNARKNVFIQSPTLNAAHLVPAIVEACERGIDVYCYICLGYNDIGELLPMQGGHNEMIAHRLYEQLSAAGRQHLRWFWYVAKDQTRPVVATSNRRSCHIKLLIADEAVAVVGSGNQDTQSWYHSQEVNVLLDSPAVCRAWVDALRRNQNTHRYGQVGQDDGVWRDPATGAEAEGATGVDPGRFSWGKGVVGAVKRLQGKGGF